MTSGSFRALRGPNVWANVPMMEAEVRLEDLAGPLSEPAARRLTTLLDALGDSPATLAREPEDERALALPRVIVDAASRLQARAGSPSRLAAVRASSEAGTARVAIGFEEADLARACLESAVALCDAAARDCPIDVGHEMGRLRELAGELLIGPTTAAVVAAARARAIPVRRLIPGRSLFQLGHGAALRRVYGSATDRTGVVSQAASTDKEYTKELLRGLGLPVPDGRSVVDAEDAWAAAREIAAPVVVKPRDYDFGHGITLNVTTRDQVLDAYDAARERSEGVLVERFIRGDDHRVLVIDGRVVAVSRRRPPRVVGDGRSTIADLVERLNADPRRGPEPTSHLRIVRLEETELATLSAQGYAPDSVPPAGVGVLLRRNSHLRNGGSMTDETDRIHPTVAAQAVDAARALGIDIAGLDIVAEDLARPLDEQGGAILEVNASPGFDLHIAPWASVPRPVGEAVVASLFPVGASGRIPIVAVLGGADALAAARLIAEALQQSGPQTGLACSDGLFLGPRRLSSRPANRFSGARDLLANTAVEAAVVEVAREGIFHEGLGFDRCDVAVILETAADADAERCLARSAADLGVVVLDADDPRAPSVASSSLATLLLVSRHGRPDPVAPPGRSVFLRDGSIYRSSSGVDEPFDPLPDSSLALSPSARLAAAAAVWAALERL